MTSSNNQQAQNFTFGEFTISVPEGWREFKRSEDTFVIRSVDDEEQVTITGMHFAKAATFEDFKTLCEPRIKVEKRVIVEGLVEPTEPVKSGNSFDMFFSGGDKKTRRVFMGYLVCTAHDLVTIYLESPQGAPKGFGSIFDTIDVWLKINPKINPL